MWLPDSLKVQSNYSKIEEGFYRSSCIKCGFGFTAKIDRSSYYVPPGTKLEEFICTSCYRRKRDILFEFRYFDRFGNLICTMARKGIY